MDYTDIMSRVEGLRLEVAESPITVADISSRITTRRENGQSINGCESECIRFAPGEIYLPYVRFFLSAWSLRSTLCSLCSACAVAR